METSANVSEVFYPCANIFPEEVAIEYYSLCHKVKLISYKD